VVIWQILVVILPRLVFYEITERLQLYGLDGLISYSELLVRGFVVMLCSFS